MNIQSITLPHCWVCEERFSDVSPPGAASREEHHIVPRAYGGADGPTVSLCASHHSMLHEIAVLLKTGKSYFHVLGGLSQDQQKRVMFLASCVYNAEVETRNDPNKQFLVTLSINRQQAAKIDQLKKIYPKAKSRGAMLALALEHLYQSTYQRKR